MDEAHELNENARKILRTEDELGTRVSGSPLARLLRRDGENAQVNTDSMMAEYLHSGDSK